MDRRLLIVLFAFVAYVSAKSVNHIRKKGEIIQKLKDVKKYVATLDVTSDLNSKINSLIHAVEVGTFHRHVREQNVEKVKNEKGVAREFIKRKPNEKVEGILLKRLTAEFPTLAHAVQRMHLPNSLPSSRLKEENGFPTALSDNDIELALGLSDNGDARKNDDSKSDEEGSPGGVGQVVKYLVKEKSRKWQDALAPEEMKKVAEIVTHPIESEGSADSETNNADFDDALRQSSRHEATSSTLHEYYQLHNDSSKAMDDINEKMEELKKFVHRSQGLTDLPSKTKNYETQLNNAPRAEGSSSSTIVGSSDDEFLITPSQYYDKSTPRKMVEKAGKTKHKIESKSSNDDEIKSNVGQSLNAAVAQQQKTTDITQEGNLLKGGINNSIIGQQQKTTGNTQEANLLKGGINDSMIGPQEKTNDGTQEVKSLEEKTINNGIGQDEKTTDSTQETKSLEENKGDSNSSVVFELYPSENGDKVEYHLQKSSEDVANDSKVEEDSKTPINSSVSNMTNSAVLSSKEQTPKTTDIVTKLRNTSMCKKDLFRKDDLKKENLYETTEEMLSGKSDFERIEKAIQNCGPGKMNIMVDDISEENPTGLESSELRHDIEENAHYRDPYGKEATDAFFQIKSEKQPGLLRLPQIEDTWAK